MLETLHIRNLALVTELNIDFGPGLNTVTGETGAGKSLIIGAVQLLAGGRATPASIRKGEKSCEVAGVIFLPQQFAELSDHINRSLEAAGVSPCEENRLLLRRVITENGSRAYINGSMVTAGFLKDICENLIDLHGPHDNQSLLIPAKQLALLDTYAGLQEELKALRKAYEALAAIQRQRAELKAEGLTPEEASLLEFQLKEIDDAQLSAEEEDELLKKYKLGSNSKRLIELAYSAQQELAEKEDSVLDKIGMQMRSFRELEQLDPQKGQELSGRLEEISSIISDFADEIGDYASSLDIDQEELQHIEERIDLMQKLKRKYGPTIDDVLQTGERIRSRLEKIRGRTDKLEELARLEKERQEMYDNLCAKLSRQRKDAAPALAEAIASKLHSLGFLKADFSISFRKNEPGTTGTDGVDFEFAPNVGEDLQPLRHAASSGEIARVMLAVKTVLSEADSVPILIFDEIDANVGGRVAVAVAEELKAVAKRHQVFSITHMPQIASAGQQHFLVAKQVADGRTTTSMHRIENQERLAEIVRMLGAESDSAAATAHARELLGM